MMTEGNAKNEGTREFLTFACKGELYAVEILRVREIVRQDAITVVPYAPSWVRGVMNLRGNVIPVVDLAVRFGVAPTELGRKTCVLIVETEIDGDVVIVGLLAEGVNDVIAVVEEDIEPAPALGTRVWPEFLIGLARSGDRFAQILDVVPLLQGANASSDYARDTELAAT